MSNKIQFFVNISVEYGHMKYTRRTKYQTRNGARLSTALWSMKSFMHEVRHKTILQFRAQKLRNLGIEYLLSPKTVAWCPLICNCTWCSSEEPPKNFKPDSTPQCVTRAAFIHPAALSLRHVLECPNCHSI